MVENLISISEFCIHHKVDLSIVRSFHEFGLIDIFFIEDEPFIRSVHLSDLEKLVGFHELDINMEGMEAIVHLLERVNLLQEKIRLLENRLRIYAPIDQDT